MNDSLKAKFFKELLNTEIFQAQVALEEETHRSLLMKMQNIDLSTADVNIQYAMIRGALEALNGLKAKRERLAESTRSSF